MDAARSDLVPVNLQPVALTASEVLVCFTDQPPPVGLADHLRALAPEAARLELHCPPATAHRVILSLLNRGHRVFEGRAPAEAQVFFDRHVGYRLLDWSPLPDPFAAACRLVWSRTAAFVRVQGTIMEIASSSDADFVLLRLAENPYLRLSVPKAVGPLAVCQSVVLLGRHDFRFGMDAPLLECVAVDEGR